MSMKPAWATYKTLRGMRGALITTPPGVPQELPQSLLRPPSSVASPETPPLQGSATSLLHHAENQTNLT
jgi:hypothetical protein